VAVGVAYLAALAITGLAAYASFPSNLHGYVS
jgi:hypothetical protein